MRLGNYVTCKRLYSPLIYSVECAQVGLLRLPFDSLIKSPDKKVNSDLGATIKGMGLVGVPCDGRTVLQRVLLRAPGREVALRAIVIERPVTQTHRTTCWTVHSWVQSLKTPPTQPRYWLRHVAI